VIKNEYAKSWWRDHHFRLIVQWSAFWPLFQGEFGEKDENAFKSILVDSGEVVHVSRWNSLLRNVESRTLIPKELQREIDLRKKTKEYEEKIDSLEKQLHETQEEVKKINVEVDIVATAQRGAHVENFGDCDYIIKTGAFHGGIRSQFTESFYPSYLSVKFPWPITTTMLVARLWDGKDEGRSTKRKYTWEADSSLDGKEWEPLFKSWEKPFSERPIHQSVVSVRWEKPTLMLYMRLRGHNDFNHRGFHLLQFQLFNV